MALGNGNAPAAANGGALNNATAAATNEKAPVVNGTNVETLPRTGKQTDPNTAFLRAARAGQLEKIREYLDSGTVRDIDTSNANGLNALHLAAKDGHIDVVRELLKRGAVVDAATKKGNTALHIASLAGQEEVVRLLIQHRASINVQSQNGFSPLYMASQENHDTCVKYLLSKGANQTLSTEDGFTPLAVAMQQGHDKVVAVLLEHDTRGKVRLPALHIAAKKDDVKAASLLLENEHNPDITSKSGFTPLHIAAHYGNKNVAQLLHERGADVNYAAKHNITPLHVASKWGMVGMVALLMEKGANIEAKTRDGLTPLHCAARSGHEQVCDMLLEKGAPIHSETKNGLAPLHMAAQGDHANAARVLLRQGAPVDDVTVDYLTALHVAAHCGHVQVARLLLEKKAHADARALNGFTPLHIACKKNRMKIVELLLKHGASISATTESGLTPLHVASFMGCMNIVIYLLQHDASPDVPTVRGETPLHLAARANQTDIIRILLRNGASVDARAREQQTPLHVASRLGNADIVVLLLQHGAQPDAATADLYTPLHIAAKEGQEEVASVLLDHNASITATTKKGFTPLHLASKYGHLGVARLIINRSAALEPNASKKSEVVTDHDISNKDHNVEESKILKGASPSVVDASARNGVTPLHVAAHYDRQPVALLLLESGASPQAAARNGHTPLHIAAKKNQMDIATTLLEHGAAANAESKAGFTPLHLSAQEGHTDMTQLLIEHGADPNHNAKNGLTPLHLAAQYDKVDVGSVLLSREADPNATTKSGYTPLHVASHYGNANMVRLLLENGANVASSTDLGYTPLHQAAQQGHTLIINILLKSKADPNAMTNNGQTALSIANKLGYITVVETLKVVTTETTITSTLTSTFEEKYRVVAPEAMHDTFMSDSEDEGGEDPIMSDQQQYRYMTVDDMKSLGDDSMRLDVTNDEKHDNRNSMAPSTVSDATIHPTVLKEYYQSAVNSAPDNVDIARQPIHAGFLVSFLVDARGGAMRGCRHSGVRVIVPPRSASSPTRVTCRYVRSHRPTSTTTASTNITAPPPLPLGEGEALASRILELGPVGAKFLGPVILEVPHFASLRGVEREILVLRSDSGETWREHSLDASNEAVQDVLQDSFEGEELSQLEDLPTSRIVRLLTNELPRYIAVVHRGRQDGGIIGPDGGTLSCRAVPQAQAVFPPNALTKRIRVALQAQPMDPALVCRVLGRGGVAVSPVLTVEPRRRKFHRAITLGLPAPRAHSHGMINQYQSGAAPTLRLLCSITGGQNRAVWEDVTGSTPLTFVKDCVTFTTTVSARFWLMDCRNAAEVTRLATELYTEASRPPFMAKFVVFAKRTEPSEASLRVFCMTDDKEDKTLEHQENFIEVAKSRDVEVLEGKPIYIECAGNLIPVTKSGEQLSMSFQGFQENRLAFTMRVRDMDDEPAGRILFMSEPKVAKGEPAQVPICTLNINLPNVITLDNKHAEKIKADKEANEAIHRADISLTSMSRLLDADWSRLAVELDPPVSQTDIDLIKSEYPWDFSKQADVMLRLWLRQAGPNATGNSLAVGLNKIGRSDIVDRCIGNVELVTDNTELALAQSRLDQSGFDALRDELGPSRDSTLSRSSHLDKNKIFDQTLDKSGFDALRDELGPSRNITVNQDSEHDQSDTISEPFEQDKLKNMDKMSSVDQDISDTISGFFSYKDEINKEKENISYPENNKEYTSNKIIEKPGDEEKKLKSILKKETHDIISTGKFENDNVDPISYETLTLITKQLDNIQPSMNEMGTPPPSPAEYADNKQKPVLTDTCHIAQNETWNSEDLHINEGPDSSTQDLDLTESSDISIESKTLPQQTDKEISNAFIQAESQGSKIPLAAKTSTPIKVKTIKKHTKLSKKFSNTNQEFPKASQRPTVENIDWDFGGEQANENVIPSSDVTHRVETITQPPIQVGKTTTITKVSPDGKKSINVVTENSDELMSDLEKISKNFADANASNVVTKTVTEIGPNGEKITRTYTEYPHVQQVNILTEIGPNGEKIVRTLSGDSEISGELLRKISEISPSEVVSQTVTEVGPNGETIRKTITENPIAFEITSKITEFEPKVIRTKTELTELEPKEHTTITKVVQKSKIPVLIGDASKNQKDIDSDSDTDSRQSPIRGGNSVKYRSTGGIRTLGSSSGSDVALHEGLSEDETDDFYQNEQPNYIETTTEEIDPITGAKIKRTVRTVSQTLTAPNNRDVSELRDSMQHVLDQFMADERKTQ